MDVRPVVIAFHGRFLQRSLHALDLAVGPGMIEFGEPVLDAIALAGSIEDILPPQRRPFCAVLGQLGELDTIAGEHNMNFVGNGFGKGFEEILGRLSVNSLCNST